MLVLVCGVVLVRVDVLRAVGMRVRMLVPGRLLVLVLMIVIAVTVRVGMLHAVRMFVRVLVFFAHGSSVAPRALPALPRSSRRGDAAVGCTHASTAARRLYGARTLSITWMTPLDWYTS